MLTTVRRSCKLVLAGVALAILPAGASHAAPPAKAAPKAAPAPAMITTASGLQYSVAAAGEGSKPGPTDYALVSYTGMLDDGTVFDSGEYVPMPLTDVIPGFAEGIQLMSRGAKYRLRIPPALGYGAEAKGDKIPANSTLVFDIELVDFRTLEQIMQGMPETDPAAGAAEPEAVPQPQP